MSVTAKLKFPDPDCVKRLRDQLFHVAVQEGRAVKVCRRRDDQQYTLRFIPTKPSMSSISSTRVREVLRNTPTDQLQAELKDLVLSPELLQVFVTESCQGRREELQHQLA